jgi:hypothetical protein
MKQKCKDVPTKKQTTTNKKAARQQRTNKQRNKHTNIQTNKQTDYKQTNGMKRRVPAKQRQPTPIWAVVAPGQERSNNKTTKQPNRKTKNNKQTNKQTNKQQPGK